MPIRPGWRWSSPSSASRERIGATVCAEGIESLDDLAVLSDLDVQWGQGFALGRPAAPWALVSPVAAEVCRAALAEALRAGSAGDGSGSPPATAGSSTSAPSLPAPAPARTSRARWP